MRYSLAVAFSESPTFNLYLRASVYLPCEQSVLRSFQRRPKTKLNEYCKKNNDPHLKTTSSQSKILQGSYWSLKTWKVMDLSVGRETHFVFGCRWNAGFALQTLETTLYCALL